MTVPAWLGWPLVGRLAPDGTVGWMRWEPGSPVACGVRGRAEAVINCGSGSGQGPTVGPMQRGQEPGEQQGPRVLEAVVLVRLNPAPRGWWGG